MTNTKPYIEAEVSLVLKVGSEVMEQINKCYYANPMVSQGKTNLVKLPPEYVHITLVSIKNFNKFNNDLLPKVMPKIEFEQKVHYATRWKLGKESAFLPIENQKEIREFVNHIYHLQGMVNPEPHRYYHITIANNTPTGNPFMSIGDITKDDENEK